MERSFRGSGGRCRRKDWIMQDLAGFTKVLPVWCILQGCVEGWGTLGKSFSSPCLSFLIFSVGTCSLSLQGLSSPYIDAGVASGMAEVPPKWSH